MRSMELVRESGKKRESWYQTWAYLLDLDES